MPTSEVQQGVIKINQCVNNDASREVFDAPETTSDAAGEVADATKQVVAEINEKRTRKDDESQDNKNQKRTKTIPLQLDLNSKIKLIPLHLYIYSLMQSMTVVL